MVPWIGGPQAVRPRRLEIHQIPGRFQMVCCCFFVVAAWVSFLFDFAWCFSQKWLEPYLQWSFIIWRVFWVNGPQFKTVGRNVHAHTQTPRSFESSYGHVCVRDAGMFTYRPAAKCTHKLGPKQHSRELTKKKMIQSCELNLHLRISGSEIHSWQMCWLNVLPGIWSGLKKSCAQSKNRNPRWTKDICYICVSEFIRYVAMEMPLLPQV